MSGRKGGGGDAGAKAGSSNCLDSKSSAVPSVCGTNYTIH